MNEKKKNSISERRYFLLKTARKRLNRLTEIQFRAYGQSNSADDYRGKNWHYHAFEKLSQLLRRIISKHNDDYCCINCL